MSYNYIIYLAVHRNRVGSPRHHLYTLLATKLVVASIDHRLYLGTTYSVNGVGLVIAPVANAGNHHTTTL